MRIRSRIRRGIGGRDVLLAVEFAYYVLNEKYGDPVERGTGHLVRYRAGAILVIASSISNGGGAALLAAEQDRKGLISGVAVSEPQIQPKDAGSFTVLQGGLAASAQGKALFDYATYAALYQPCIAGGAGRCAALVGKGLLAGADTAAQQADAYARMRAYGWLSDSDILQAAHAGTNVLVAVTYANAYGRFAVDERVWRRRRSPAHRPASARADYSPAAGSAASRRRPAGRGRLR
jgi:hydroxybutyrate-dimer hydrolase